MRRATPERLAEAYIASSERIVSISKQFENSATPEGAVAVLFTSIPAVAYHALIGLTLRGACTRTPGVIPKELQSELVSTGDYALVVLGKPLDDGWSDDLR